MKTQFMSMQELERIARNTPGNREYTPLQREACARELAKRENQYFHFRYSAAQRVKAEDYLR